MALQQVEETPLGGGMFPTDHAVFGLVDGLYEFVLGLDRHARATAAVTG